MKYILALLFASIAVALSDECSPSFCSRAFVVCDEKKYNPCDGVVLPNGPSYCDCCPRCAPYKNKGDRCDSDRPCRPPMSCSYGICKK